jgi:hypothetical protein
MEVQTEVQLQNLNKIPTSFSISGSMYSICFNVQERYAALVILVAARSRARGSAVAGVLGLWVRIPPGAKSVVCSQV